MPNTSDKFRTGCPKEAVRFHSVGIVVQHGLVWISCAVLHIALKTVEKKTNKMKIGVQFAALLVLYFGVNRNNEMHSTLKYVV